MKNYDIGYKKPPERTRYKKGCACPNPKGRGARKSLPAGRIFEELQTVIIATGSSGKKKRVPRNEIMAKKWAKMAAEGDLTAAELLLDAYCHSKKHGDYRHQPVPVQQWELEVDKLDPNESAIVAAEKYNRLIHELNSTDEGDCDFS